MNSGFHRAIVSENADPEKLGRVRVEYPWFQGDSSQRPSEWAEICLPYASQSAGFWFLPEIGDEVLVYLENGNLDSPIIFGTLYSQKQKPPQTKRAGDGNENNKNDLKAIVTRSGHMLCFDDSDSKKEIVLSDVDGNQVSISPEKVVVKNSGGDEVTIQSGTVTVKSQSVKIEAAGSLELGSGASEALIKGQSFMSLFNSHTHVGYGGTTSPPTAPMTPDQLSTKVKTA